MSQVTVSRTDRIIRFTLDRARKRNALSAGLVEELLDKVLAIDRTKIDVVVFDGAGPNFCAGFDFNGIESATDAQQLLRFIRLETLLQAIATLPMLTVALVHGAAVGAGADLVVACDTRIGAPGATFRFPGLRFGVVLGTGRLASRVGADHAREVQTTGASMSTSTALEIGLLTQVADRSDWDSCLDSLAQVAGRVPPSSRGAFSSALRDTSAAEADLSRLARSASIPGLADRMRAYYADRS